MPMRRMMRRPNSRTVTVIAPRYVEAFLAQSRKDYRKWKRVSDEKLEELRSRLPNPIPSWEQLHRDQKVCALIGARQPRFAFWNDPGTGKTMLALTLAKYHDLAGSLHRVLVLVPNNSNLVEWEREITKHYPQLKFAILSGSSEDKWATLRANPEALITVATYPGLTRMVGQLEQVERRGKRKNELQPDPALVQELQQTFQGLILDESSEVKSHDALIYGICKHISRRAHLVLCLSGTPFGRDPHALWTQMNLVDGGESLGETLGMFRGLCFQTTVNRWGGYEHNFIASKKALLNDLLANRSIRFEAKEADLPAVSMIPQRIELSQEAKDWYDRARSVLRTARGDFARTKNTFLQMRQLSSGFVSVREEDEDGTRAKIEFAENPKLEQLMSIVRSIPLEYPVIIVHEFIYSGERIEKELREAEIPFVSVRGGTKDPGEALRQFKAGEVTRLVINHKAGGFGLNLQNASYMLFYESPVSAIMRRQVEARIVRNYSEWERVFIYDLMVGSADERIREFHAEGRDLFQAILHGEVEL